MRRTTPPVRWRLSPAVLAVVAVTLPMGAQAEAGAPAVRVSDAAVCSTQRIEAAIRAVSEAVRQMNAPMPAAASPIDRAAGRPAPSKHRSASPGEVPMPLCLARPSLIDLPPPGR